MQEIHKMLSDSLICRMHTTYINMHEQHILIYELATK